MWLQIITLDNLFKEWKLYNDMWGKAMTFESYYDAVKLSGWEII